MTIFTVTTDAKVAKLSIISKHSTKQP